MLPGFFPSGIIGRNERTGQRGVLGDVGATVLETYELAMLSVAFEIEL